MQAIVSKRNGMAFSMPNSVTANFARRLFTPENKEIIDESASLKVTRESESLSDSLVAERKAAAAVDAATKAEKELEQAKEQAKEKAAQAQKAKSQATSQKKNADII